MIKPLKDLGKILAVDVGAGTQDILFFDPSKKPENNIKAVLPSQTKILAKRISGMEGDLLMTGATMGGGPVTMAILGHLKKGFRVVMTESSARTIRDDLDEVKAEGVEIIPDVEAKNMDMTRVQTSDVDLEKIMEFIKYSGEGEPDFIGVALQDHGFEKGKSDRLFRFETMQRTLEKTNKLESFLYEKPPVYYTRMNSLIKNLKDGFAGRIAVIDSKFAAVAGALHDVKERPCLCVDVGNGHTLASIMDDGVSGVFEHHTHALSDKKLADYLRRFCDGDVAHKEVFDDDGHGCFTSDAPGMDNIKRILVTGPNRDKLKNSGLDVEFANPFGDVMMAGPVGIVDLVRTRYY